MILRWLVASHMLLACAPVALGLLPAHIAALPVMWALVAIQVGQWMLLGFWGGMGLNPLRWRIGGTLLGCAYSAIWPALGSELFGHDRALAGGYGASYRGDLLAVCMMVAAFGATFSVVRRWFSELRLVSADETGPPRRMQYSILALLVITTVVALLLGLARSSLTSLVLLACLVIDALCAVWAVLGTGRIRWRLAIIFLVALLLASFESISTWSAAFAWWLPASWVLISLPPVAIVVASLMVVRACGYRLVPKLRSRRMLGGCSGAAEHETAGVPQHENSDRMAQNSEP